MSQLHMGTDYACKVSVESAKRASAKVEPLLCDSIWKNTIREQNFWTMKRPLGNLVDRLLSFDNPHKVVDVKSAHMTQSILKSEIFDLPSHDELAFFTISKSI